MNDVKSQFVLFLNAVSEMKVAYISEKYSNLDAPVMSYSEGRKYYKIINNENDRQNVWGFVSKENGDILKAASWAAPAKHARGNIFDDGLGMSNVGPYGPCYLK